MPKDKSRFEKVESSLKFEKNNRDAQPINTTLKKTSKFVRMALQSGNNFK